MREKEELNAARAFGLHHITVLSYPDTLLPNHWHEVKRELLTVREQIGEDRIGMILCPERNDRHQDHRVVAENAWRVFRDHLILEYETPNVATTWMTREKAREPSAYLLDVVVSREKQASQRKSWDGRGF